MVDLQTVRSIVKSDTSKAHVLVFEFPHIMKIEDSFTSDLIVADAIIEERILTMK